MVISAAKYFVVGALGTVTHLSLLYVFVEFFLIPPLPATSLAFIWVIIQSYFLNRNWTFESDKNHTSTLPRYLVVCGIGFASNLVMMFVLINIFGLWYMLAQALAAIVIPLSNFLLNKYWTFS